MTLIQLFRLFVLVTGVWLAIGSIMNYINWRAPLGFYFILPKLLSASLSPYLAILSVTHMLVSLIRLADWGTPETAAHLFEKYSPIYHVQRTCPPTLLLQGEHDIITPPRATRLMADRLQSLGIPVTNVILPYTEHGFDLVVPVCSPTAHVSLLHIKAFLGKLGSN